MKFAIRPSQGGHDYGAALEQTKYAEECGLDSVFLGEHHGLPNAWSDPLLALGGFATATSSVGLGTAISILPFENPVKLAGRIGLLDEMSDGRAKFGFGVGWLDSEFETLGVPKAERGRRMDEYLEIIDRLLEPGPSSYEGEFYEFEDYEASPYPDRDSRPEILLGGTSDASLKRAAVHGDGWVAPGGDLDDIVPLAETYREFGGETVLVSNHVTIVRESRAEAIQAAKSFLRNFKHPLVDVEHPHSPDSLDRLNRQLSDFESYADPRFIVYGTPDDCIEKIERVYDRVDFDEFLLNVSAWQWPNDEAKETIRLLGEDVLLSFD